MRTWPVTSAKRGSAVHLFLRSEDPPRIPLPNGGVGVDPAARVMLVTACGRKIDRDGQADEIPPYRRRCRLCDRAVEEWVGRWRAAGLPPRRLRAVGGGRP